MFAPIFLFHFYSDSQEEFEVEWRLALRTTMRKQLEISNET